MKLGVILLGLLLQGTTATVSGTISDSGGAVVPGARIVILNVETGITREVQSDEGGRYTAPSLGLGSPPASARSGHATLQRTSRSAEASFLPSLSRR